MAASFLLMHNAILRLVLLWFVIRLQNRISSACFVFWRFLYYNWSKEWCVLFLQLCEDDASALVKFLTWVTGIEYNLFCPVYLMVLWTKTGRLETVRRKNFDLCSSAQTETPDVKFTERKGYRVAWYGLCSREVEVVTSCVQVEMGRREELVKKRAMKNWEY